MSVHGEHEAAAREQAARDAFLVHLSDALRPLSDPVAVKDAAARALGEQLSATRAFYADVEPDGAHFVVERDYADGVPSVLGRHELDGYGPALADALRAGNTVAVACTLDDPLVSEEARDAWREIRTEAFVGVPLVKSGSLIAILGVDQRSRREWTAAEVAVVEQTAERTWAAVERARAEQRLRKSHDTFFNLIQNSPLGVYLVDADFRLAQVSRGAQKVFENVRPLLGRDFEEVLRIVWPEPFASEALALFRHTLETGEPYHSADTTEQRGDVDVRESYDWQIERVVLPDGRYGVVCYFYDFTELRAAQDALRESEARFRSMANAAPTIIWTADPSGSITFHNQRWLEYTGLTPEQNADEWASRILHPDDAERCANAWNAALASGDDYEIEVRNRRFDGRYRWFLTRATAQRDDEGRIVQWLGSSTDIHDRKQMEERMREREAAERRARENAELLTAIVSELEAVNGVEERARRLVDLLVPRVADSASISLPGSSASLTRTGRGASSVVVPLALGAEAEATLALGRVNPENTFSEDELALVGEIAERAALLLGNARLRDEEHGTALRLQRALLPNVVFRHPAVDIAARYEAGGGVLEVGGDWYDSFSLRDGRIGIAVGDVVGHGLDAAATMGRMRTALAALASRSDSASDVLGGLDEFASGPNGTDFATACYGVLDPASGELTHASAGHPPMLVVDGAGAARWLDDGRSAPLGVGRNGDRPQGTTVLEPGSLLVLYSDGLVERPRERLSAGLARLERLAVELHATPLEEVCEALIAELGTGQASADDIVVMCLRLLGVAAGGFRGTYPARPEQLARIRADVREWLTREGVGDPEQGDVLLALGEACANAVEHAYPPGEEDVIEVEMRRDAVAGELLLRVRDFGRFDDASSRRDDRGRGTSIMEALSTDFMRTSDPDGTSVAMRIRVPGATST